MRVLPLTQQVEQTVKIAQLNRTRLSPDHERLVNRRCSLIAGVGSAARSAVMDDLDLVGATAVSAQWLINPRGIQDESASSRFEFMGKPTKFFLCERVAAIAD